MLLKFTYSDGETVEHEVDDASTVTVDGPARNADGGIVNGRLPATYAFIEARGPDGHEIRKLVDVALEAGV